MLALDHCAFPLPHLLSRGAGRESGYILVGVEDFPHHKNNTTLPGPTALNWAFTLIIEYPGFHVL